MSAAAALTNRTAEVIAAELLAAKRELKLAQAGVYALEDELVAALDSRRVEDEGAKTYNIDGFKVVIKRALNRKGDLDGIKSVKGFPAELLPVKVKEEVDATGLKYLQNNEPKLYAKLAPFLTVTAAKVAVEVSRVD
jgi:hypothetical protein